MSHVAPSVDADTLAPRHPSPGRPRPWRTLRRLAVAVLLVILVGLTGQDEVSARPIWTDAWQTSSSPVQEVTGGVNLGSSVELTFASRSQHAQLAIMRQVRATGATWIRIAMPMPGDEYSKGNFTWYSDPEVKAALATGLHVDGLIGWPAKWARNSNGSPNLTDWALFAETAAKHYSALGVRTFEMWNEPNTSTQWGSTGVDIAGYAKLLRTIYPVIKANEPDDNVMLGGLAPVGDSPDRATYSPLTFLTDLYRDGAGGYFDSVGFHPYSFPDLPAQSTDSNPWTILPQVHAVMRDHGDGAKKVWFTEFGAPVAGNANDVSPIEQGLSYEQAFAIARGWSWSGPIFAYSWIDWDGDGTGYYGLHTRSGHARPALHDFELAIASKLTLRSTRMVPAVHWSGPSDLTRGGRVSWVVKVTGQEAPTYAGWTESLAGQPVTSTALSTTPSGSVAAATIGPGIHTIVLGLHFADGSTVEVLSPTVFVTNT